MTGNPLSKHFQDMELEYPNESEDPTSPEAEETVEVKEAYTNRVMKCGPCTSKWTYKENTMDGLQNRVSSGVHKDVVTIG